MLRHILRSWPRSPRTSQIFRQRMIVAAPLQARPSVFIYLGVSVATIATIITIHGDADQPKKLDSPYELFPQRIPPSPTTDETFDLASSAGIPEENATGISRIDSIVLARYSVCMSFHTVLISSFQPIATTPAKTSSIKSQLGSLAHSTILCLECMMDITEVG